MMRSSLPQTEPTYEYTGLFVPHVALTRIQKDLLLLCAKQPRTLPYLLTMIEYLHPNYQHFYASVWRDIVKLRRYGLMQIHAPTMFAAGGPATNIPEYQFKPTHRRLAA